MQRYYAENNIVYQNYLSIILHAKNILDDGPVITSLSPGFEYLISKKDPEPLQLSLS
jgi:hypothetical protein